MVVGEGVGGEGEVERQPLFTNPREDRKPGFFYSTHLPLPRGNIS